MSTFGGAGGNVFGGPGGANATTAGIPISELVMPAYRIAGITQRARIVPSQDMYDEAIPALNRLAEEWGCDGHKVYSTAISAPLPLTTGQKAYTIGPGGDLNVARPIYIRGANILLPTSPVVRRHVDIVDDDQWRSISVQDVPGAPPYQLYYDGNFDSNGRGQVYLRFQPPAGYSLELYTWQSLQSSFTNSADVALLPPGYAQALIYGLAKHLAARNPNMANMSPRSYELADQALQTLIVLNSKSPRIGCDPAIGGDDYGSGYGWLDGGIR